MSDKPLALPQAPSEGVLAARVRAPKAGRRAQRSSFWRMVWLVYPHRRTLLAGLLLGLGVALTYSASLGGLLPVLKVLVDQQNLNTYLLEKSAQTSGLAAGALQALASLFPGPDTPHAAWRTLLVLIGVLFGVNLLGNVMRCFSQYLVLTATNRAMMDLRRRMYRKALHVPVQALAGDVSNRVSQFMSDAREVFLGLVTLFGKVAREPLKAVCVLALALWLDWRVTLVAVGITPIAVALLWTFGRRVRKAMTRMLQGYGRMLGGLEETLQGADVVKGHVREAHERKRMWRLERDMLQHVLRLAWIESISSPLIEVIGVGLACGGIVWLAGQTLAGEMEPSRFMTLVVLLTATLDPIRKVANVYNAVQRAGAAAQRIFDFLDQPDEHSTARGLTLPGLHAREVRFEAVTYRYAPEQPPALQDVTLRVAPGECLAVVGPNGSGKSTLLKLLSRLIEPESGGITLDGLDVRRLQLRWLREQIAIVSQRPTLFARSVRENIAYGHPDATDQQVRDAAQRAYAAEFIERWPRGYDTELSEFGGSISGGQRQRIAIARAFLKPASILIFDEATSEVDAESEQKIHAALRLLRAGKTTFLIAHRHTVMDMADRIVVMDGGRIVDAGPHAELLARCPLYAALYRSPQPH